MGASEVVSEPMAMPLSIWPVAILAAMPMAACRLVPQACCMVMPGVVRRELGAEHRLARQVPVPGVGDDGAAHRLVDVHAGELVLVDQGVEHGGQHLEVGLVGVERVGAAERDAHAADDSNAPQGLVHGGSL